MRSGRLRLPGAVPPGLARPDRPVRFPQFLAALLSGAIFALAFPQPDMGWLAWVALVPLFVAAHHRSPRAALALGYVWGIAAYGGVLIWLGSFGAAVWALAAALAAVAPAVALLIINWVERDRGGPWTFLWVATVWTAVEFLRSQGPLGFPWALAGASQHRAGPVIQIASITGVYGVTFLVLLANATLYAVWVRRGALVAVCGTGVVLAGATLWGSAVFHAPVPATFVAAAVQPGFRTFPGVGSATPDRDFADLRRLTHAAALAGAALVVWPETASPTDVLGRGGAFAAIREWARRDRVSLVATSLEGGRSNSAFAITPSGALTARYDKFRLVPFAEIGEQPGAGPVVLPTPPARIGVAICFESTFPDIARRSVRQGANLLAVLSNDAWFDGLTAPVQHAALAPFRAVEERRYLVRAANEGISAIIDPHGRVLGELPLGARGVLAARVAPMDELTVYARVGDAFGWGVTLLAAILIAPRTLAVAAGEAGTPAFARLLTDSLLPLAALAAAASWRPHLSPAIAWLPLPPMAVLAVAALLGSRRRPAEIGLRGGGFVPALALGLIFVGGLVLMTRQAWASHGLVPDLLPQGGQRWQAIAVQVLAVGLPFELWLRGLVFADAAAWRGWKAAVVWSGLLGAMAESARGGEAMVWALCAGAALGVLRARWAQVPALAIVHGVGDLALGFLFPPW